MRNTTYYNMVIGEGTDLVNPLTQIFPNFETIDAAMEANKESGITTASEVTTGGVHAITRTDSTVNVFRYTATSAWTTGDTMTLDGSAVTVHLMDGTTPKSGDYVIGAEVLAIVNGSLVTLLVSKTFDGVQSFNSRNGIVLPQSGDYTANMIGYNNTASGLSATNDQDAIDEVAGIAKLKSISGTTTASLATAILALTDVEFVESKLVIDGVLYYPDSTLSTRNYRLTWVDDSVTYSSAEQIFDPATAELNRYSKPVGGGARVVSPRTISSWTLYHR